MLCAFRALVDRFCLYLFLLFFFVRFVLFASLFKKFQLATLIRTFFSALSKVSPKFSSNNADFSTKLLLISFLWLNAKIFALYHLMSKKTFFKKSFEQTLTSNSFSRTYRTRFWSLKLSVFSIYRIVVVCRYVYVCVHVFIRVFMQCSLTLIEMPQIKHISMSWTESVFVPTIYKVDQRNIFWRFLNHSIQGLRNQHSQHQRHGSLGYMSKR